MNSKELLKGFLLSGSLLLTAVTANAQIVRAGIKAGTQLSWLAHDDKPYLKTGKVMPVIGFNAGGVLAFKVRERYFLHTEYIYSQKGKSVTGKIDPALKDKVVYHYFDVPILFTMHFKAELGKGKFFKWYVGAGPNTSYWLGGKGVITAGDLIENGMPELEYKIVFGTRVDHNNPDHLYIKDANRLQFGMNFGAGIVLEPADKQKIMIDLRYEVGHTRLGKANSSDFLIPAAYDDNLKARNKGLRLSLIYLLEYNLDPKARNKGKSTLKK